MRNILERAGISQTEWARLMRLSDARAVRNYLAGDRKIPGSMAVWLEAIDSRPEIKELLRLLRAEAEKSAEIGTLQ